METLPRATPLATTASVPGMGPSTLAGAGMAVLQGLESSLLTSVRALLGHDASVLDLATRDQIRLRRALEILWAWDGKQAGTGGHNADRLAASGLSEEIELAADLRAAQLRVLHLGRVQAALLRREGRWLHVLASLVAGPGANYGSAPGHNSTGCADRW
jgi:hypothetical protein